MAKYDYKSIEEKWQRFWDAQGSHSAEEDPARKKTYILDMFPYPSAYGIHVGHPVGYTATDVVARKRRMDGFNVLHPMGWDAFGLPAENFAIKTGVHPKESTAKNVANFRRQLKMFGFSYDWRREVDTSSPEYYRWTQWLFLFMYKNGLAVKKKAPVNWCESCQTVLANEQVVNGMCERSKTPVIQKELSQWFFRVTEYADRLLDGLDRIDWPEKIKAMQRNWIGRSEGVEIVFKGMAVDGASEKEFSVPVFTTRPDTLFGVQYVVLAPEHPLVMSIVSSEERDNVAKYVAASRAKTDLQRTGLDQEKTGVPLGVSVVNPLSGEKIPLWVADYALATYGTGAVMGVPAHDDRDFAFAKTYGFTPVYVVAPTRDAAEASMAHAAYTGPGYLVRSAEFDGLTSEDAKQKIADALESRGAGSRRVNYHLRDWLISRQRYWGAPIPIIYCDHCGEVPVPEELLPVTLPDDVDFRPTGESPLARSTSFQDVTCPHCHKKARRESDTMDTFVDSSWYFLRFASPQETGEPFSKHSAEYWCPVDLYVGGAEHAVLHLLYARFFTKVLFDRGMLSFDEPFTALKNPGLILGEDGQKMSKSRGNVVNPDDVIADYGADALRMYLMFMGDFEESKPWDTKSISGVSRFLDRAWFAVNAVVEEKRDATPDDLQRSLHRTIKKVGADIEAFKFNTAISSLMILLNEWYEKGGGDREFAGTFVKLVAPFAPHIAEELWQALGNDSSIFATSWPTYDEARLVVSETEIVVQVDGRVRDRFTAAVSSTEEDLKAAALARDNVRRFLEGKHVATIIVVKGRVINIVTKS